MSFAYSVQPVLVTPLRLAMIGTSTADLARRMSSR
jgi:hypothetical protein